MSEAVALLQEIVRIPSVSGDEARCRDHLANWLGEQGLRTWTSGRNVLAELVGGRPAAEDRGLLLLTHIDVVPVGPGWTRDPFDGALEGGRIHGRGANDAKASVAAMAVAAARADRQHLAGRVVLAFVCDEETGGEGIEACGHELPPFDASAVGEPTELDVCPGQRGLFRARLEVRGRQAHASRPWEGDNAIFRAAAALEALAALDLGAPDPLLGPATLQPTVIQGGTRPNVLPGACTIELDGRPTPTFDNATMAAALVAAMPCEVVIGSNRFLPVRTPEDARIVRLARAASPTGRVRAFGGVSDLFHVRHRPGVVMGPGTSDQSHAPDESVAASQVEAGVKAYGQLIRSWLAEETA